MGDFWLRYPDPKTPSDIIFQKRFRADELTEAAISSYVPRGYVFVGLLDEDDFDQGDDLEDLEPGYYTVCYNVAPDEERVICSQVEDGDVVRAALLAKCQFEAEGKGIRQTLTQMRGQVPHDIFATAVGIVESDVPTWTYVVALTPKSVLVTIQCDSSRQDFLDFDRLAPFSSRAGQGQGLIHPAAFEMASALPYQTLFALCTSNSPVDWTRRTDVAERRLVFTGHSMGGSVAHVAALLAREQSMLYFGGQLQVQAVGFHSPHTMSLGIVQALQELGVAEHHLTFSHDSNVMMKLYQLALDVQVSRIKSNDSFYDVASLIHDIHQLEATDAASRKTAWRTVRAGYRGAMDMVETHEESAQQTRFFPVGHWTFLHSDHSTHRSFDPWSIALEIGEIPFNERGIRNGGWHRDLYEGVLKSTSFQPVLRMGGYRQVEDLGHHFLPTVTQCNFLIFPESASQKSPARVDINVTGGNLENILHRGNGRGVVLDFVGQSSPCHSPIQLQPRKELVAASSSFVVVANTAQREAKLVMSHVTIAEGFEGPILLKLRNDFGESEMFEASVHVVQEQNVAPLHMFSSFNSDMLLTTFTRSLMLMHAAPTFYLTEERKVIEERAPDALKRLCEIECLFLQREKSKLWESIQLYCKNSSMLSIAAHTARQYITEIIEELMKPFRVDSSKFPAPLRKVMGAFGCGAGAIITILGGVLAGPGLLLAVVPFIGAAAHNFDSTGWTLATLPGILLSLPGLAVSGAGAFLVMRSYKATRDPPSMQYGGILRLLLKCLLGGDPDQVLDEVPSLEQSVVTRFQELYQTQLWDISDDALHRALSQTFVDPEESLYLSVRPVQQLKLRTLMRAAGKIYTIRNNMEEFLVVGFVGVHNAGKSTWINRLFGVNAMADSLGRTETADLYPLRLSTDEAFTQRWREHVDSTLRMGVVDYPGSSDERESIADMASQLSSVTTLFVCVFRFGHIAKPEKEVMDMVKATDRDFVVLINQCDIARDLDTREQEYRQNYAGVLEIDPSLIHFVSVYDEGESVHRVRQALWNHLNVLVHDVPDQMELAMNLMHQTEQDAIMEPSTFPTESDMVMPYLLQHTSQHFLTQETLKQLDLYRSLPLITRVQPVESLTTRFDGYPPMEEWKSMAFEQRKSLFREQFSFSTFTKTTISLSGENVFGELCNGLMGMERDKLANGVRIDIQNDVAIDVGGPLRAAFDAAGKQVRENTPLFKSYDDLSIYFHPQPVTDLERYRAFGRVMGMALLHGVPFPGNFSLVFFKLILGYPISFRDFEILDKQHARSIKNICELDPEELEDMCITFSVQETDDEEVDLCPNGRDVIVSQTNITQYLRQLTLYKLGYHLPLKVFVLGVQDVVPRGHLCLFTPEMLQLMVNGLEEFTLDEFKSQCSAVRYPHAEVIEWFWQCVEDMDHQDRALLLSFITGSSVLPVGGLRPPIAITGTNGTVPVSHTCFHQLELPHYASQQALTDNLLFAIRNTDPMYFGMV